MAYNHEYPYVDPNRYNADWILHEIMSVRQEMSEFEALNTITFAGEWNITKQYPAWCIVNTNNEQEGYISIKPVPAGITIDNRDYWVSIVNYAATIADLQNRVVDLENAIDDVNDRIDIKHPNLHNRKILFIGDSYAGIRNASNENMFAVANKYLDASYTQETGAGYGFTLINGVGTYITLLNRVTDDRESYTDICVCGGCNDYDTVENTSRAIKEFCDFAALNFPNAKVTIAHVGGFATRILQHNQIITKSLPAYRGCEKFGAKYMENSEYIMYSPSVFQSDNIHPTSAQVDFIGEKLAEGLLYGRCDIEIIRGETPTAIAGETLFTLTTSYLPPIISWIHNNRIGMISNGYMICKLDNISPDAYNYGTFEHKIFNFGANYFGIPSDWTTGKYAFPVFVTSGSGVTNPGILSMNTDGTMTLTVKSFATNPGSLTICAQGVIDMEFDLTRY